MVIGADPVRGVAVCGGWEACGVVDLGDMVTDDGDCVTADEAECTIICECC